jgi:anti-sigma factor RsiW
MSSVSTCGRVRRVLWPDGGPRATSPELIDAQEHLAQCEACQQFVREMRAHADWVRDSAREQAPAEVRRRLFTAVARARAGMQPSPRRLVPVSWLVAAVVLLVFLGGTLAVDHVLRHRTLDPMSALADDHARALGDAHIASADPAAVSRWLAGQVHFAMLVPALPNGRLLGARLRVMDGRRGAAVQYEVNGVAVTYFVIPVGSGGEQPSPGTGAGRFERLTRAGYRVVAWREPGLLHAMVGSLSESQLATLAEACIKQARGTVASVRSGLTTPMEA